MSFPAVVGRMLLGFAVALGSRVANAEPQLFVELDYQPDVALACPSETALKATVSEQLGYDPFRQGAEQKVIARTRSSERGLRGVIEWRDASGKPRGERELDSEGSDCAALVRSMSFAIVVQIQLLAQEAHGGGSGVPAEEGSTGNRSEAERASSPSVAAASAEPRDAQHANPERPSDEAPSWEFQLGVGPTLAFGLAPRTLVEGRAFVGLRRGKLAFELGGEASLTSQHETENDDGFEQQVLGGSVAGCMLFGRLSGCLVNKVGRLSVRGFGVDVPKSDAGILWLLGPRLTLIQGFGGPWFGSLRVEALASLHRWEVTLDQEEVWETPLFSLSVGGDLGLSFQ